MQLNWISLVWYWVLRMNDQETLKTPGRQTGQRHQDIRVALVGSFRYANVK